jgi:hypothetical protein
MVASIMAWRGKDGDFRSQGKRRAARTPRAEAACPTLSFDAEMRQLGMCIVDELGRACVNDTVEHSGAESTRVRTK